MADLHRALRCVAGFGKREPLLLQDVGHLAALEDLELAGADQLQAEAVGVLDLRGVNPFAGEIKYTECRQPLRMYQC